DTGAAFPQLLDALPGVFSTRDALLEAGRRGDFDGSRTRGGHAACSSQHHGRGHGAAPAGALSVGQADVGEAECGHACASLAAWAAALCCALRCGRKVSSTQRVVTRPCTKSSCASTASWNAAVVVGPST